MLTTDVYLPSPPQAHIPAPLSEEQEAEQKQRAAEKKKLQNQKRKEKMKEKKAQQVIEEAARLKKEKEEEEKRRFLQLSDREKVTTQTSYYAILPLTLSYTVHICLQRQTSRTHSAGWPVAHAKIITIYL